MIYALLSLAIALAVAVPLAWLLRRRIANHNRPARYAHLTDEQWAIRRAVLLARRASNAGKEPPMLHQRSASQPAFGKLFPDDSGHTP